MGPISPPLTAGSPLATIDGWTLVLSCATCSVQRAKPVSDLRDALQTRMNLNLPPNGVPRRAAARSLGEVLPRLTCEVCRNPPTSLKARCDWVTPFAREVPEVDLSFLIQRTEKAA